MEKDQAKKLVIAVNTLSKNIAGLREDMHHLMNLKIVELVHSTSQGNKENIKNALEAVFRANEGYEAKHNIVDSY